VVVVQSCGPRRALWRLAADAADREQVILSADCGWRDQAKFSVRQVKLFRHRDTAFARSHFRFLWAMVKMAVRTIARTSLCHSQQNRSGVVMNSH
jgi:hypothetical protein